MNMCQNDPFGKFVPKKLSKKFNDWEEVDDILENEYGFVNPDIPTFDPLVIVVGGRDYYFLAEEWFEDCMESRCMGITNKESVESNYLDIMINETGLIPDKHNYLPYAESADFGITYIAQDFCVKR